MNLDSFEVKFYVLVIFLKLQYEAFTNHIYAYSLLKTGSSNKGLVSVDFNNSFLPCEEISSGDV